MQRAPPQLKIFDPLFRVGTSRPQRMHNGLPLSLLDFLLVTAMMLVTPNDEWMNVTRTNPPELVPDSGPSDASFSSGLSDHPLLEATPEIERWRSSIPARATEDNQSQHSKSSDRGTSPSSSRATSRLSFHTDFQSSTQHSTHLSEQGVFSLHSGSSVSLSSHALSHSHHGHRRRELPAPPPLPSSYRSPSARGPLSALSHVSHVSHLPHGRHFRDEPIPIPIPPLPGSSSASPFDFGPPVMSATSVSSRSVAGSPTSSIHSRLLPVPPNSSASKPPPLPLLPHVSSPNPAYVTTPLGSPLPGHVHSVPQSPTLSHSRSYSHLRNDSSMHHDDKQPVIKAPPNYNYTVTAARARNDPSLAAHARATPGVQQELQLQRHEGAMMMSRSLSIRTAGVAPVLSAPSADTSLSLASEEDDEEMDVEALAALVAGVGDDDDPYDMPPAYSSLDEARSTALRLHRHTHAHAVDGRGELS